MDNKIEKMIETKLPDWQLDLIQAEVDRTTITPENRKVLTLKMLRALMVDVQEGRIDAMMMLAFGTINADTSKHFQWLTSDTNHLLTMYEAIKKYMELIEEQLKKEAIKHLRDLLTGGDKE